jgi:hypothetical protein
LAGLAVIGLGLSLTRADPALMVAGVRIDTVGAAVVLCLAGALSLVVRRPAMGQ